MHLLLGGQRVELNYLLFGKGVAGQVVEMRIASTGGAAASLHHELAERLRPLFEGGVMDQAVPGEGGFTEIRVLNATHLQVIDAARLLGIGVSEIAPAST